MGVNGSPEFQISGPEKSKKKFKAWSAIAIILAILLLLFGISGMGWSAAFGLIGFLGIVSYVVCLIIAAAKKDDKRAYAFGIIVSLALVVIGVAIPSQPSVLSSKGSAIGSSSFSAPGLITSTAQTVLKPKESDVTPIDYKKLYANNSQYKDKYVRFAGKANYVGSNYITINDGLGSTTNQIIVYWAGSSPPLKAGDYVLSVGKVGIKALGSLAIRDSYLEASGDKAKVKYDEYEKASAQAIAAVSKNYKASCKTYKYKDVARNPDTYKGKPAKFTGKVIQVEESGSSVVLRVNITKGQYEVWNDTVYVEYERKSDTESRILEDDIVTMYGTLNGIKQYTAVLGNEISIPLLEAEYIDISK